MGNNRQYTDEFRAEAVAAAGLGRAVFVGEPAVLRIGLARGRMPDQPAQVLEERLRIAALVAAAFPFGDKVPWRHACPLFIPAR